MANTLRKMGNAWMRATEPLLLNRKGHETTARALRAARIGMFPEWYLGVSYLVSALVGAALVAAAYAALAVTQAYTGFFAVRIGIAGAVGMMGFLFTRLFFLAYPRVVAQGRARRVDAELPAVITLSYALAKGGVNPLDIFRAIAEERSAYGEAAVEFGVITRHVDWMGQDLVSAMKATSSTTPSLNLKGFLEGLTTILNSGADPKDYFKHQAERQLAESELNLEKDLEQASMLAEIYVSGLLVLPLLLLVVLSGLAPIAPGQDALMPFVVYAMIPLGTLVYLILLETMLPPDVLTVPKTQTLELADFGLDTVSAGEHILPAPWEMEGKDSKLARGLAWDRFKRRSGAAWHRFVDSMMANPLRALSYSGVVGALVAAVAGFYAWNAGYRGADLVFALTGVVVAAGVVTVLPISIFHEIRVRHAREVEEALPDALSKLAGFNERGISLLQSFQLLGRSANGPLAEELQAVERDVSWTGSLRGALRRLRMRVSTLRMTKLGILLERSSAATGDLREVLQIAADDATRTQHLRSTKRQSMMSYLVVVYIVFAVFVYVLYVVANLFYGPNGLGASAATTSGGLSAGLAARDAKLLFAHAAVIQAVGCGLVGGRLGEGHLLSGLKHAIILGLIAYIVFLVGVL
jgi:archaeal flagellar protein FlaJ